jgi:ubiquinone biosynthesis protein Coq4
VKLHDLHHIATGYEGDWPGEAEIGAWEIAAGCGRYAQAWLLNLGAMTVGLFIAPRKVFRAFAAGRRAETLYHTGLSEEALATTTVGDLRERLRVGSAAQGTTAGDIAAFASWSLLGIGGHALVLLAIGVFAYLIFRAFR